MLAIMRLKRSQAFTNSKVSGTSSARKLQIGNSKDPAAMERAKNPRKR